MHDNSHTCDAFVLACIDFRFHKLLPASLSKLGIDSYDLKCDAGAAKYLCCPDKPAVRDWLLENIEISKRLHHIKKIVLINHYDCGAYGGNSAWASDAEQLAFQTEQLRQARNVLAGKYSDLEIISVFAEIAGDQLVLRQI